MHFEQLFKNRKQTFFILFGLAFIVRLIFIFTLDNHLVWYDEIKYDEIARGLLENGEYGSTAFAPLQPFFLFIIYSVFGKSLFAARFIQALLGAFTVLLVYGIGKKIFQHNVGLIAGIISIFYPYFIFVTGFLYPTTLFTFFLTLMTFLLITFYENERKIILILAGVSLGLCFLCIPAVSFISIILPVWFLFCKKYSFKQVVVNTFLLAMTAWIVIAPWSIRNSLHYGKFVFITSEGGHAFWQGNNELFDGMNRLGPDDVPAELKTKLEGLTEAEQDQVYFQESMQFIKENPGQFCKLYIVKFVNFWRLFPKTISQNRHTSNSNVIVSLLTYGLLLPLCLVGLYLGRKKWSKGSLLILVSISFALGYSLFLTSTRYRIPVDPYVIIFASVTLHIILAKFNIVRKSAESVS